MLAVNGTAIKQQQLTAVRTTYSRYHVSKFYMKISETVILETTMYKKG